MPLILSGNVASAVAGAYSVANSCRFNDGDSPDMTKTPGATGDVDKFTISAWIKLSTINTNYNHIFNAGGASNDTGAFGFRITDEQYLGIYLYDGSSYLKKETTRVLRDPAAWYHVVCAVDTEQDDNNDRIKLYVNGVLETSFSTTNTITEDIDTLVNAQVVQQVGCQKNTSGANAYFFDGYMAEVCLIDGSQLAASSFGEFDDDSPTIWKPIDVSGLTFGTNGFYLDFEASGNLGNDANGGTDLTETNIVAADQATDSPTNNFATMNPLDNFIAIATYSEGNLQLASPSSGKYSPHTTTMWLGAGKWYCEVKETTGAGGGVGQALVGITDRVNTAYGDELGEHATEWGYYQVGGFRNNNATTTYGDSWTANDIIGIALDITNSKLYFSKNGTWQDDSSGTTGDPTSGASGTGAISITAIGSTLNDLWTFSSSSWAVAAQNFQWNFGGCPAFAISSGNADDNGYGNFEYDVPAGYLAVCSKNLGSDGG